MRMDLHIHSSFSSDGRESPTDILKYARNLGLGGVAILDHNEIKGSLKAYQLAREMDIIVVRGLEVSTEEGHIVAYGVDQMIPAQKSIQETAEIIQDLGGISVAPHPYRFWSGIGGKRVSPRHFSGVEVQNARCTARNNRRSLRLAERLNLGVTGGTDAHNLSEIGKAYTNLETRPTSEDEVIHAISSGRTKTGGESRSMQGTLEYVYSSVTKWIRRGMRRI